MAADGDVAALLRRIDEVQDSGRVAEAWEECASTKYKDAVYFRHCITRQVTWDRPRHSLHHLSLPAHVRASAPAPPLQRVLHRIQAMTAECAAPYNPSRTETTPFSALELLPLMGHSKFLTFAREQGATRRAAQVANVDVDHASGLCGVADATAVCEFDTAFGQDTTLQVLHDKRGSDGPPSFDVVACFAPINLVWASSISGGFLLQALANAMHPEHGRLFLIHADDGAMRRSVIAARTPSPCTLLPGDSAWWWWTPARHAAGHGMPVAFWWQPSRRDDCDDHDVPMAFFPCTDYALWRAAEAAQLRPCMSWDLWTMWNCLLAGQIPAGGPCRANAASAEMAAMRRDMAALSPHDVAVLKGLRLSSFVHVHASDVSMANT